MQPSKNFANRRIDVPTGTPNPIPNEAIRTSEKLKVTSIEKKGKSRDPFSEERVSKDQPSHDEVQNSPPDDTVEPG